MRRSVPLAAITAIGLVVAAGCLSRSYDADFLARLKQYREEGELSRLHGEPKSLKDGRLLLRVPKLFTEEDPVGEKEQSKPPFLQAFPGFATSFGSLLEADGVKLPVVLSVGVLVDNDNTLEDIKAKILNQVQKEAAFAKETWAKSEGEPDANGQTPWSILRLVGPQSFERITAGVTETKNTDGTTEIWVASHAGAKVAAVLVWRVPQELDAAVRLPELAGLVALTVEMKVAPPAEPPAAVPAAVPAAKP